MVLLVGSLPDLNPEPGRAEAQYGGPTGCWLLAAGYWLLVAGDWLLVTGYWLLVAGCWLPWTGGCYKDHWMLVVGCLGPLAVDWWLATVEWTMV